MSLKLKYLGLAHTITFHSQKHKPERVGLFSPPLMCSSEQPGIPWNAANLVWNCCFHGHSKAMSLLRLTAKAIADAAKGPEQHAPYPPQNAEMVWERLLIWLWTCDLKTGCHTLEELLGLQK